MNCFAKFLYTSSKEDSMELKKRTYVVLKGCLLFLFIGALVACQSRLFSYRGATAEQQSRIALLEGGPYVGFWKTEDLSMHYRYLRYPENLELSGVVELANRLKYNFTTLEYLFLQVNLLDAEGKVLESKVVLTSDYRHMIKKLPFKRSLELPPGITAIAFSYKGRVLEGGGTTRVLEDAGDGDSWDFWRTPFR